jgi:hypothetical protein
MTNPDAEGKRQEAPPPDEVTAAGDTGAGPPAGGMPVPPQRSSDRPGWGGIEEAGLGGGTGDLGGGEAGDDLGGLDDEANRP